MSGEYLENGQGARCRAKLIVRTNLLPRLRVLGSDRVSCPVRPGLRCLNAIGCSTEFWAADLLGSEWSFKVEAGRMREWEDKMACRVQVVTGKHAGSTPGDGERKGGGVGAELQEPWTLL